MALMIKSILYPGLHSFAVAPGKEQSAAILSEKITEICKLIPALTKEVL